MVHFEQDGQQKQLLGISESTVKVSVLKDIWNGELHGMFVLAGVMFIIYLLKTTSMHCCWKVFNNNNNIIFI